MERAVILICPWEWMLMFLPESSNGAGKDCAPGEQVEGMSSRDLG